jgi:hypothetical protein
MSYTHSLSRYKLHLWPAGDGASIKSPWPLLAASQSAQDAKESELSCQTRRKSRSGWNTTTVTPISRSDEQRRGAAEWLALAHRAVPIEIIAVNLAHSGQGDLGMESCGGGGSTESMVASAGRTNHDSAYPQFVQNLRVNRNMEFQILSI